MHDNDPDRPPGRREGGRDEEGGENAGHRAWSDRGHGEQYEQSPPFEDPHVRQRPARIGGGPARDEFRGGNYERMQYGQGARQHSGQRYGGEGGSGDERSRSMERPVARIMPKGYTRSDVRIREDICEHLGRSGLDVSDVSVEVSGGKVTLEGTVKDRYAKHAIEDCADDCMGVQEVDNRIRVQKSSAPRVTSQVPPSA
jgi:hypothetical protein